MPKKNSTTLSSFAPPILFLLFDYVGVVLSEHLAFALRDFLDYWNRVTYLYGDAYIYGWVPLLFLIFLGQSRSYRQMKPVGLRGLDCVNHFDLLPQSKQPIVAAVYNFVRAVRPGQRLHDSLRRLKISQAAKLFLRADNFNRRGTDGGAADKILARRFGLSI